jgi:hypothetical protein
MLGNEADAASTTLALAAASYSAGANNGAWVDCRNIEGDVLVSINVGARTGSIAFKIQDATDGSGTGSADVSGLTLADIGASASSKIVFPSTSVRGFVRLVATVTTGPALIAATVHGRPKNF